MMKFNSKHIILCFLIIFSVLLVSVSSVCAQDTNNITDLNNNDNDDNESLEIQNANNLNATGTFDDLQAEIDNATEGSVLNLIRDYNGAYGSRIQFNKNLTINGQGHTLDCLNTECSAFYSSSGSITLMNLKIINGHNDDNAEGGAIHISGSAQYKIINCTFNNNWADNYGGAIYNHGVKPLTIINSTFNNNKADDDDGGAIYSISDVYIENSIFTGNNAFGDGGAIHCYNAYTMSDVYIENSIFTGNNAFGDGGAIHCYNAYITNCLFDSNKAKGAKVSQCEGGAIYCIDNLTVDNSTFKNNYAGDYGGAAYAKKINVNNNQDSNQLYNSFFINNTAGDNDGGALHSKENSNVKNAIFTGNNAFEDGGAIFCGDNAYITNCLFDSNKAKGTKVSQCEGGAIYCKDDLTVDNSTFKNNYAGDYGGAIYADTLDLKPGCIFDNNTAYDNQGGAIWVNKFREDVKYATFINNKAGAKDDGGAIYINKENHVTFSHCTFKGNYAGEGGAIYLDSTSSELTLKDNSFIDNFAGAEGLDVFNKGTYRTIEHNWWGTASPDFSRGQLVEWRFLPWKSNLKHFDSNSLKSAPNELDSLPKAILIRCKQ